VKEREVESNLTISEYPRPLRRRRQIGGGRSQDCLPQTLRHRALISPCDLAAKTAQQGGEEHVVESADHRIVFFSMMSRSFASLYREVRLGAIRK
jgi:hypothetical protein